MTARHEPAEDNGATLGYPFQFDDAARSALMHAVQESLKRRTEWQSS
jgi:hypothetical protein